MGVTQRQKEILVEMLSDKSFVEALSALFDEIAATYVARLRATQKNNFYDEAMSIITAKSSLSAVDNIKTQVTQIASKNA